MHRSKSYDEMLSGKLHKKGFAQEFIIGLMEGAEGLTLEDALRHTINRMGITEFSKISKVSVGNVALFLKKKRNLKPETLNVYLKPFGLKSRLTVERAA